MLRVAKSLGLPRIYIPHMGIPGCFLCVWSAAPERLGRVRLVTNNPPVPRVQLQPTRQCLLEPVVHPRVHCMRRCRVDLAVAAPHRPLCVKLGQRDRPANFTQPSGHLL